jgi:hypothetical protein
MVMRIEGAAKTSLFAGIAGAGAGLLLGGSPVAWGLGAAALTYGASALFGEERVLQRRHRTGFLHGSPRGMHGGWYFSSPSIEAADARQAIESMYPQWPALANSGASLETEQPSGTYPGYGFGGWGWGHGL